MPPLGIFEILTLNMVLFIILILIVIGLFIHFKNPITKLKENTIYFQGEPGPSHLLLRKSSEQAELKLYKIKGADQTKMPRVFAVTDKDKDIYKIVSYEPTIIGESPDRLPDELQKPDE